MGIMSGRRRRGGYEKEINNELSEAQKERASLKEEKRAKGGKKSKAKPKAEAPEPKKEEVKIDGSDGSGEA